MLTCMPPHTALAVILCACIMSVSSLEVIQLAALDLYSGFAQGGWRHRLQLTLHHGVAA